MNKLSELKENIRWFVGSTAMKLKDKFSPQSKLRYASKNGYYTGEEVYAGGRMGKIVAVLDSPASRYRIIRISLHEVALVELNPLQVKTP